MYTCVYKLRSQHHHQQHTSPRTATTTTTGGDSCCGRPRPQQILSRPTQLQLHAKHTETNTTSFAAAALLNACTLCVVLTNETQVETAAVAALDRSESSAAPNNSNYMNMLQQLLRLRQACNHPWLVKGAPGVPEAFAGVLGGSVAGGGGSSGGDSNGGSGSNGGGRGAATAAEVAAVRRLAADSQAALLQVRRVGLGDML